MSEQAKEEAIQRLMVSIMHLEKAYDQVRYLYAELAGINKRPTNLSQDAAQLFAFHDRRTWDDIRELTVNQPGTYSTRDALGERLLDLAAGDVVTPRVQTNSLHQDVPGRGMILDCTILDGSNPDALIGKCIRYQSKIYAVRSVEMSSSAKHRVGCVVEEVSEIPFEDRVHSGGPQVLNHMVQNPGGWPQGTLTGRFSTSEPTPPHVHAMGHEERQRYENGGVFAQKVMDKAWEEQKKQPWTVKHDYADLELRVFALALKQMGIGEWFHELMEMVCFPDVDDINYMRDQIKEHLNDDRVKFLHEGEAPSSGDSGLPEDHDNR